MNEDTLKRGGRLVAAGAQLVKGGASASPARHRNLDSDARPTGCTTSTFERWLEGI